ncbi:hypothetical protein PO909_032362 [Leuciscus waleckii]
MAERESERKAPVCRSVSFKKLDSWSAKKRRSFGEDLDRCGALPPDAVEHSAQPSQATHAVSVSRKVSKISAASLSTADLKKASHGIYPSVRELSEKFSLSTAGTQSSLVNTGSVKNTISPDDSSLNESGCLSKDNSCEYLNFDSTPAPPPHSRTTALPLRSHGWQLQEQRQRAEQPQPPDSSHSTHNSSQPQTGPSVELAGARGRLSSGEEDEELSGWTVGNFPQNKHGTRAKLRGRSSGSEEDSPAALTQHNSSRGCYSGMSWARDNPSQRSHMTKDSFRHLYRNVEGSVGTSPVPQVSRVSKVTIPSFISSPLGSKNSSRYSSTETLKEEDKPANIHSFSRRSPSFGHGDNFSRAPVRVRPKLVASLIPADCQTGSSENRVFCHSLNNEKDRNRISMSNPDIASETLSLLSYLKTDLSELRMRKKGQDDEDNLNSDQGASVYRMGSRTNRPHHGRPSLKDLTATLRRAKSFTYSEKPVGQQYCSGPSLRSSSEQRLDSEGSGEQVVIADREVESDDCRSTYGYEEAMPTPLQDRYVQEARQVIRDICQMSESKDDDDDEEEDHFKTKSSDTKIDTENMFCEKSLDELSGHESSLTDEGIVTEPEVGSYGGLPCSKDLLGQTLTGALEAPSTPSAIRRRRKFSSAGNNGSESSNGSNGESNVESAYRSLSDPMPHRRCSVAEDGGKSFSMDSNLLGSLSLNSKVGGVESSAADLSEYTGSAASDLSVCSDSLKDYSTVIQSIVCEPGAMDNLIDEKANGKAVKKKSFSDPSRRGDLVDTVLEFQKHPSEPISEQEQSIPPSSSEPILSEQRDELWDLNSEQRQPYCPTRRSRSQSEHVLPSHLGHNGETKAAGETSFPFDPKLAQVLSPRITRRSPKKRTNRFTHQVSCDDGDQLDEQGEEQSSTSILPQLPTSKVKHKHVRHASEPATFVPIIPSHAHVSQDLQRSSQESLPPNKIVPGEDTPSLEDVTEQYILALNSPESPAENSAATGGVILEGTTSTPLDPTTEPKLERKSSEELSTVPLKAKPRVVSDVLFSILGI